VALIFVTIACSQMPAYSVKSWIQGHCIMYACQCLLLSFQRYSKVAPTHSGMARLSWPDVQKLTYKKRC